MADYYAQVIGTFGSNIGWSFGTHITSNQNEATLLTTWTNAWEGAWTNATYGLAKVYPTTTEVTEFSVATLNSTMHEISKSRNVASLAGTAAGDTLPYLNAVVVSLRSNSVQKHGRGRMFLPALEETFVNGDVVIPTALGNISQAVNTVLSAIIADGSTNFVTNKKALKDGTPPYQKTQITKWMVSNKPARQARRTKKIPASYM